MMTHKLESVSVGVRDFRNGDYFLHEFFTVGMILPDGSRVKEIEYYKSVGLIQIISDKKIISFVEGRGSYDYGGEEVQCNVEAEKIYKRRPAPPSPHEEELKLMQEYLAESERKNKVLTEKLDSMRNAYHAECEENARLKNQLPVPYERHEIMVDDSGEQIAVYETNDVEFLQNRNRELENANREKATIVRWYERRLADEQKVSSHLTEEDRFKATMSGALGSAGAGAIVYSLFNIFF